MDLKEENEQQVAKRQKIGADDKKEIMIVSPEKDLMPDRVILDEDLRFFELNGYVIIRNAVPDEMCDDVVESMYKFCKMTPNNPQDWYRPPVAPNGFVEMYHQQSMWNTRQYPRIYRAFAELWNTGKLWVSIDRVCMKLPQNPIHNKYNHKGFVHWDLDPWERDIPFGLQGVLALADTTEHQGGFHCVPGMHKFLVQWIKKVKESQRDSFHEKRLPIVVPAEHVKRLKLTRVAAKKGDLIIWRRELAHGNGLNTGSKPRLAQYINMYPARDNDMAVLGPQLALHPERRFERIKMVEGKLAPNYRRPNTLYDESVDKTPIELTELGKKLAGIELWK